MTMKSILTDVQLLLADLQINKAFKDGHRKTQDKRFRKIVKSIRMNIQSHLEAITNPKIVELLNNTLFHLKNAYSQTEQLSLITMMFILLLNEGSNEAGKFHELATDITSDLCDYI